MQLRLREDVRNSLLIWGGGIALAAVIWGILRAGLDAFINDPPLWFGLAMSALGIVVGLIRWARARRQARPID